MTWRLKFWIVVLGVLLVLLALGSWTLEGARWVLTGRGTQRPRTAAAA